MRWHGSDELRIRQDLTWPPPEMGRCIDVAFLRRRGRLKRNFAEIGDALTAPIRLPFGLLDGLY
jgi:hypothetical protein